MVCCLFDDYYCDFFQEKQPFERIEVTRDQALEMFSDNKFKVQIIPLVIPNGFVSLLRELHVLFLAIFILFRLKLLKIYLKTKLSQYTDVAPW